MSYDAKQDKVVQVASRAIAWILCAAVLALAVGGLVWAVKMAARMIGA